MIYLVLFLTFLTSNLGAVDLTLTWDKHTDDYVNFYTVYYATNSLLGMTTEQAKLNSSIKQVSVSTTDFETSNLSKMILNLDLNKIYYFRLSASNILGDESGFNTNLNGLPAEVSIQITPSGPRRLRVTSP